MNALKLCHWKSFHTKKLCSRLSFAIFYGNRPFCVFETPFGWLIGQRTTIILGSSEST